MSRGSRTRVIAIVWGLSMMVISLASAQTNPTPSPPVSEATETCLTCHTVLHPALVADWEGSHHAKVTPEQALEQVGLSRRFSAPAVSEDLQGVVVGCAECHTRNPDDHADTFLHNDYWVHTVVTPNDCAVCHPQEASEFEENIMSRAHDNLARNPLYRELMEAIAGPHEWKGGELKQTAPDAATLADACYSCHGTEVAVEGLEFRETDLGEMEFPRLVGWPNQGVGRINPDGSQGSCSACHTRHKFSVETARKPHTCSQCHKGPDVPATKVYQVSKHGNLYASHGDEWDFDVVPWTVGRDFSAPTCAVCHISLVVDGEGEVAASRTHRMSDRLFTRIFGLPYAHPQPLSPETHGIVNSAGLALPTELSGEPVSQFLIDPAEQEKRKGTMKRICISCHSNAWVEGHFRRLDHTVEETNQATRTATLLLEEAWKTGVAQGPAQGGGVFDEPLERLWVESWLFYANSIRFAAAMGGADYGVFAGGRWQLSRSVREMEKELRLGSREK